MPVVLWHFLFSPLDPHLDKATQWRGRHVTKHVTHRFPATRTVRTCRWTLARSPMQKRRRTQPRSKAALVRSPTRAAALDARASPSPLPGAMARRLFAPTWLCPVGRGRLAVLGSKGGASLAVERDGVCEGHATDRYRHTIVQYDSGWFGVQGWIVACTATGTSDWYSAHVRTVAHGQLQITIELGPPAGPQLNSPVHDSNHQRFGFADVTNPKMGPPLALVSFFCLSPFFFFSFCCFGSSQDTSRPPRSPHAHTPPGLQRQPPIHDVMICFSDPLLPPAGAHQSPSFTSTMLPSEHDRLRVLEGRAHYERGAR